MVAGVWEPGVSLGVLARSTMPASLPVLLVGVWTLGALVARLPLVFGCAPAKLSEATTRRQAPTRLRLKARQWTFRRICHAAFCLCALRLSAVTRRLCLRFP